MQFFKDENGLWHAFSKTHTRSIKTTDSETFVENMDFDDKKKFLQAMLSDLKEENALSKWMGKVHKQQGGGAKAIENKMPVKDATMLLLQEAHDSYTRVSLQIKKLGMQIMNHEGSDSVRSMHILLLGPRGRAPHYMTLPATLQQRP